ncbi:MAG TPA: CBS domain-containing protein [Chloroflexota bacterium]|nr:CBS domain-containing protein [Chloroflexota bacterium]
MAFLSQIVGKPVYDSQQHKLGKLNDVSIPAYGTPYPSVSAIQIGQRWVPWNQVKSLEDRIELAVAADDLREYTLQSHDVRLRYEVLDHQIVDIEGRKVRRVNDLALSHTNGHYSLMGVDISTRALMRRLGLGSVVNRLGSTSPDLIAWADVDPVRSDTNVGVRLRRSRQTISRLHPSDLADIVEELTVTEGVSLLNTLDDEHAADVLEEVEDTRQADILEQMESERAADILEEMAPDDAADVLAEMDPEKAQQVLSLMEAEAHEDVAELLGYDEDTAGGIMTTDYVAAAQDYTAAQTLEHIRTHCREIDMVYNVYVVHDLESEQLSGVVTLRDLIMADPSARLASFMHPEPASVKLNDNQEEVARTIAKYNLMSIPVVDADNRLHGIVTVDDAVDILLPTAWKKRLPKIF